jgi:hypothetical protein
VRGCVRNDCSNRCMQAHPAELPKRGGTGMTGVHLMHVQQRQEQCRRKRNRDSSAVLPVLHRSAGGDDEAALRAIAQHVRP